MLSKRKRKICLFYTPSVKHSLIAIFLYFLKILFEYFVLNFACYRGILSPKGIRLRVFPCVSCRNHTLSRGNYVAFFWVSVLGMYASTFGNFALKRNSYPTTRKHFEALIISRIDYQGIDASLHTNCLRTQELNNQHFVYPFLHRVPLFTHVVNFGAHVSIFWGWQLTLWLANSNS